MRKISGEIKNVVIVGANGTVGAKIGAIVAAMSDCTVYMMARTYESALKAIESAKRSLREEEGFPRMVPCTYGVAEDVFSVADWIYESVTEDMAVKQWVNEIIGEYAAGHTIVTTGTSGLSIAELSLSMPEHLRPNYFGTHFYNPPVKLMACEIVVTDDVSDDARRKLEGFLVSKLRRKIVNVEMDRAAFAGNYIGVRALNVAARLALSTTRGHGVQYIDYVLGRTVGNAMPPMKTIDYIGLDVYFAILKNMEDRGVLEQHHGCPSFIKNIMADGNLGLKTLCGLYEYVGRREPAVAYYDVADKAYHAPTNLQIECVEEISKAMEESDFKRAVYRIARSPVEEVKVIREYLFSYMKYALEVASCVVKDFDDVDRVMEHGFASRPPSFWIDLFLDDIGITRMICMFNNSNAPLTDAECQQLEKYANRRSERDGKRD